MKYLSRLLALCVVALLVVSCATASYGPRVTDQEAKEAILVSLHMSIVASIVLAFDGEIEGATWGEDDSIVYDDFDLAQLNDEGEETAFPYTSLSGTAAKSESGGIVVSITLAGGPVVSLEYELDADTNLDDFETLEVTAIVNGREMDVVITREDAESYGN